MALHVDHTRSADAFLRELAVRLRRPDRRARPAPRLPFSLALALSRQEAEAAAGEEQRRGVIVDGLLMARLRAAASAEPRVGATPAPPRLPAGEVPAALLGRLQVRLGELEFQRLRDEQASSTLLDPIHMLGSALAEGRCRAANRTCWTAGQHAHGPLWFAAGLTPCLLDPGWAGEAQARTAAMDRLAEDMLRRARVIHGPGGDPDAAQAPTPGSSTDLQRRVQERLAESRRLRAAYQSMVSRDRQ